MALKVGAAKRPISIAIEFKKITGIKGPFGPLREGLGGWSFLYRTLSSDITAA
jgi:hypothetical protein